jgi:CheY-like chemotaxis protein
MFGLFLMRIDSNVSENVLPNMSVKILFVEDDLLLRSTFTRAYSRWYSVSVAEDGLEAFEKLQKESFDVIVSDVEMPRMGGVAFHAKVSETYPELADRIIFCSGGFDQETGKKLARLPNRLLLKPCDPAELRQAIQEVAGVV